MATIINELPEQKRPGRTASHPWGEWFDGQVRLLVQGEDFDSKVKSFKAAAFAAARARGYKISTRCVDDKTLALQKVGVTVGIDPHG